MKPRGSRWRRVAIRIAAMGTLTFALLLWITYLLLPAGLSRVLGVRPGTFAVDIERGHVVTASDGTRLVADVYRPRGAGGTTPTILVRIPYSKTTVTRLFGNVLGRFWAEHGHTAVIQGTRGRYESGGTYYPLRGERQDGLDTLAWLEQQSWFDGRLGMWGGSYFGYTQWVLADQINPGPTALLAQLCSTDFYRMFYPGGAFSLESALAWATLSRGAEDLPEWPTRAELAAGFDGFPLEEADDRTSSDIGFFNDWVRHPARDDYWRDIDGTDRAARLAAPALLMAGWFDPFLPSQLADFMRIRQTARPAVAAETRLIVGPWAHANSVVMPDGYTPRHYRLESIAPSISWFDRHLRPPGAIIEDRAPVRLFVMGYNIWRDEQEWPLARMRPTPYYLHSGGAANTAGGDGTLSLQPPAGAAFDTYTYDPRKPVPTAGGAIIGPSAGIQRQNEVAMRQDVLVYTTTPLEDDVEVTGPIELILHVTTSAPHTDFMGKLVDVHPDGSAYNVSDGALRRAYESGGGAPAEIRLELWPTSMVFRKGHRLRLEVASSNYPRYDRHPNTVGPIASETAPATARQTVHHGALTPSRLILPVIPAVPGKTAQD